MGEEERESTLENKLWKKPLGTPSSRSFQAETIRAWTGLVSQVPFWRGQECHGSSGRCH